MFHHAPGSLAHAPHNGGVDTHMSGFVVVAAACGYGLTCLLNIVAARILPASEYGAFSAAVAMVAIICTIATLGLEKCALRILPEYIDRQAQGKTKGYIIFGIVIGALFGGCCARLAFVLYDTLRAHDETIDALAQMLWFVPAITLFLFALEVATACGSWLGSTLVYRLLLPAGTVVAVVAVALSTTTPTLRETIDAYGLVWIAALAAMIAIILHRLPVAVLRATSSYEPRQWLTKSVGYLGFSLIMTVFSQGAVVMLEVVKGDRVGVGMMAAAMQIAGFVVIAQTATMRVYAPQLARVIASGDAAGERLLMRSRSLFMIAVCGAFLAVIVFFGRDLLALFGENFRAAYPALVVMTIAHCVNTVLGFAPAVLQYHGAHRLTLTIAAVGTIVALIAMAVAAKEATYLEVAQTYAVSLIAMYIAFQLAILSRRRRTQPK